MNASSTALAAPPAQKLHWAVVDYAQLPSDVAGYLGAQAGFLLPGAWVSTPHAGRWYALFMTAHGPSYLTFTRDTGLGFPSGFNPGHIIVQNPAQAVADFATALANYIQAHGCDGTAQMVTLVKGYQGAIDALLAGTNNPNFIPFTVDGIYTEELQTYLAAFAKVHGIPFTPCTGLPHTGGGGQPPPKTGGTQQGGQQGGGQQQPSTGLSTNAKIGIGVGVLAAAALGLWVYSESTKKEKR